jgi:hypothetical protein
MFDATSLRRLRQETRIGYRKNPRYGYHRVSNGRQDASIGVCYQHCVHLTRSEAVNARGETAQANDNHRTHQQQDWCQNPTVATVGALPTKISAWFRRSTLG